MRKLLLPLLIIGISAPLKADMRYGFVDGQFFPYTIPAAANINQDEYAQLFVVLATMQIQAVNSGVLGKALHEQEESYLRTIGSPTALRLLEDLKKLR